MTTLRRISRTDEFVTCDCVAIVHAAYAAPTVFSGQATFAGYIKLDDTATYLAMLDRVMTHGRSLAGLGPSTYEATLGPALRTVKVPRKTPLATPNPTGGVTLMSAAKTARIWPKNAHAPPSGHSHCS